MPKIAPKYSVGQSVVYLEEIPVQVVEVYRSNSYQKANRAWMYRIKMPNGNVEIAYEWDLRPAQQSFKLSVKSKVFRFNVGEEVFIEENPQEPMVILDRGVDDKGQPYYKVQFNSGAITHVWDKWLQPGKGQMRLMLSKKGAWLEKSRDMYRVEPMKPAGKDRTEILGPPPRSIPNTWTELPKDGAKGTKGAKFLKGDQVGMQIGGKEHNAKVTFVEWSDQYQQFFYHVEVDGHELWEWEGKLKPAQGRLFAMKVKAGEVIPLDPSRRKPRIRSFPMPMSEPTPSELTPEMEEDRAAVLYAYDNMVQEMKGLYNNMMAIGEEDIANNIRAAYQSLTGEVLEPDNLV